MLEDNHYSHITAHDSLFNLKLREVWEYKDLIWLFTKRSFQVRYRQTILGPAWLFISPFFTSVVYTFVFGNIAQMSTDGLPHILFYMISTALWSFFSSCITNNASTFTSNAGVFGKVYFPRLTVPISNIISSGMSLLIQLFFSAGFWIYYFVTGRITAHLEYCYLLPIIILQLGVLGMGMGIIISSLTTKYRDLRILVGFGVSLFMYASPVVYPLSQLNDNSLRSVLLFNPVTPALELIRFILLGKGYVLWTGLLYSTICTVVVACFGIIIFNHVERTFMDTV